MWWNSLRRLVYRKRQLNLKGIRSIGALVRWAAEPKALLVLKQKICDMVKKEKRLKNGLTPLKIKLDLAFSEIVESLGLMTICFALLYIMRSKRKDYRVTKKPMRTARLFNILKSITYLLLKNAIFKT